MYRNVVAAFLVFLAMTSACFAKTFPVPDDNPVATVNIPNSWDANQYDAGVEATSEDGDYYVAFEGVTKNNAKDAAKEALIGFLKQGVQLDVDNVKTDEVILNGMPIVVLSYKGRDQDGPTNVRILIIPAEKKNRFLIMYTWGSDEADAANAKDIDAMLNSITLTK